jgi:hypothetical protein
MQATENLGEAIQPSHRLDLSQDEKFKQDWERREVWKQDHT